MACLRQKAKIEYPCKWSYKIIAGQKEQIEVAVEKICKSYEYELQHSNSSKKGKYISMNLTAVVEDESQRVAIFKQLEEHEDIKMVL